ncbi:MAG: hypothetical protein ACJA06_000445 [Halocynthiibacter sp.]|jgi:uncharacterized protein YjiS (DUF1127 family)
MSMIATHQSASQSMPSFGLFARAVVALQSWNELRKTRKALGALNDHMLEDIGLTRSDIAALGQRSF